jgi:hypothetical protein
MQSDQRSAFLSKAVEVAIANFIQAAQGFSSPEHLEMLLVLMFSYRGFALTVILRSRHLKHARRCLTLFTSSRRSGANLARFLGLGDTFPALKQMNAD